MHILKAEHLEKIYKKRRVVQDISLQIKSTEIVGLLGPNGAGKTTSFYMIVGLVPPSNGEIFLDKQNITNLAMHERARLGVGYLPQEASVFRKLSVADNIMGILELIPNLSKEAKEHRLEKLLKEFHIEHLRSNIGISLSGGERRRVEIARALAVEPKFILLDEPFAGIDPLSVIDIKKIITQLHEKGIGILITDHNVRETLTICHRAYIVNDGNIIAHGTPQEIMANKQAREVYLGDEFLL